MNVKSVALEHLYSDILKHRTEHILTHLPVSERESLMVVKTICSVTVSHSHAGNAHTVTPKNNCWQLQQVIFTPFSHKWATHSDRVSAAMCRKNLFTF